MNHHVCVYVYVRGCRCGDMDLSCECVCGGYMVHYQAGQAHGNLFGRKKFCPKFFFDRKCFRLKTLRRRAFYFHVAINVFLCRRRNNFFTSTYFVFVDVKKNNSRRRCLVHFERSLMQAQFRANMAWSTHFF